MRASWPAAQASGTAEEELDKVEAVVDEAIEELEAAIEEADEGE